MGATARYQDSSRLSDWRAHGMRRIVCFQVLPSELGGKFFVTRV
jgi:hypothetical protein